MSEAVKLDSQTQPARAVVVLGMHRSGTSAVTRLINLMGAPLGSRLMTAMEGNNETGFWEHQDIVDVHEDVLTHLGRRWDDIRAMPAGFDRLAELEPFRRRLIEAIQRDFAGQPLWAVKDPRMCRLMPLWQEVFPAVGAHPHYVIVLRNPIEVARSLERRDGFAMGKGLLLWLRHALEAERHTRGASRNFVRYETVVSDWAAVVDRMARSFGLDWPRRAGEAAAEVEVFLRRQLRHHAVDDLEMLGDERLSRWVRQCHGALLGLAERDGEAAFRQLDAVTDELAAADALFEPVLDGTAPLIDQLFRRVHELEQALGERDTRIRERDTRIREREGQIGERDARIAERDTRIAERDWQIQQRDVRIHNLNNSVRELQEARDAINRRLVRRNHDVAGLQEQVDRARHALLEIMRSKSWRFTEPLRMAIRASRKVAAFARSPGRLLRWRVHNIHLEPLDGLAREGDRFVMIGGRGELRILSEYRDLPTGRCIVSYTIEAAAGLVQPFLYSGDWRDLSTPKIVALPPVNGDVRVVVDLPETVGAMRIEPLGAKSAFAIRNMCVIETGPLSLLTWAVRERFARAVSSREEFRVFVKNALALLRRPGDLAGFARPRSKAAWSYGYDDWIAAYDRIDDKDRAAMERRMRGLRRKPVISIAMPTYNSTERWLRRAIDSVIGQIYPHWELCIADDASTEPRVRAVLEEYRLRDQRIKVTYRSANGHISAASNSALALATGEFVALLDHDDELPPHALYMVAEEINEYPDVDLIYSDEDKIDADGARYEPYFKSDYNPDLLMGHNMISHLGVYRRAVLEKVGGFREGYEGSQDYDLALRTIDATSPARIRHIPHVLYHWRAIPGSVAKSSDQKEYAHDAARRGIRDHLQRVGKSQVEVTTGYDRTVHRTVYPLPDPVPRVSVIVPTRDKVELLRVCVDGVLNRTDYADIELIVVDNQSRDPVTLDYLRELESTKRARVLRFEGEFNFSGMNNYAVRESTGTMVCLLNNDIEPIGSGWLKEMVAHALRPEVGAVGAKLYYPNDKIQHGGVILGVGGVANHAFSGERRDAPSYFGRATLTQNYSAVTAACMVVRRAVFDEIGGLDETNLRVAFNDINFCLQLRARGYLVVWTPYAELYHHESASRGSDFRPEHLQRFRAEISYMRGQWGDLLENDPYYNPNLTLDRSDFSLAFPPRAIRPWLRPENATAE